MLLPRFFYNSIRIPWDLRKFLFGVLILSGAATLPAHALPSFARQTGQDCVACHVGGYGPQLTAYGAIFKLEGYTDSDGKEGHVPLSAMAVGSWTRTKKKLSADAGPYDNSNNNFSIQELSLFLAGGLTDHIGTFVQGTYSDIDRQFVMDNVDIRYATTVNIGGADTILGVTFNNNPTVQDPFNTVPAWRFPYMASELAPGPIASPLLDGGLSQQVLGASVYGYWDKSIYGEIGAYGSPSKSFLDAMNIEDEAGKISGLAPYWRLGYFKDLHTQAYGFGLFGLNARLEPDRVSGPTNKYNDIGIDGWYQFLGNREHVFSAYASYINEHQNLDASFANDEAANSSNHLNRFDLSGSYYYHQTYGFTAGLFDIRGSSDDGLYAAEPDSGSSTGSPDTQGWIFQVDWTPFGKENSWNAPWANLRLGLQYTLYTKFNGAKHDYDGYGRDASDNNTIFAFIWAAL